MKFLKVLWLFIEMIEILKKVTDKNDDIHNRKNEFFMRQKLLLISCMVFLSAFVRANDVVLDGIKYHIVYDDMIIGLPSYAFVVANNEHPYSGKITIKNTIDVKKGFDGQGDEVTIQVRGVDIEAFKNCDNLTSVTLSANFECFGRGYDKRPDNMIGRDNPFIGCESLEEIIVNEENGKYDSRDGCNAIIETSSNRLIYGCKNTVIPNSVKSISDYAFYGCTGLTSLNIPEEVDLIGWRAFSGCTGLLTVSLSHSTIEECAFENCTGLSSADISDLHLGYNAFGNCTGLKSVSIHGHVMPNTNVTHGSMEVPFNGCSNLKTVTLDCKYVWGMFRGLPSLTDVTITENAKLIDNYAFMDCTGLVSLTFPQTVESIASCVISGCTNFKDLTCLPPTAPQTFNNSFDEIIKNVVLHVPDYAIESYKGKEPWVNFMEIVVIEKVTDFDLIYYVDGEEYKVVKYKYDDEIIPEEYPVKEGYTFSGWEGLPTNMPGKDVKVYGTFARNEVKENRVIYWALNEKAFVIGNDNASGDVIIAEKVTFNEKELPVIKVVSNAFEGCKGISTIELPATITNIGERAFAGIDKLTDVTIYAENVPETDWTAFENSYVDYATLHVPNGSVDKYKAVGPWKDFKEIIAIEGTEPPFTEKCNEPTIEYKDGKLFVNCGTEGAECVTSITSEDVNTHNGNEIEITATYNISAYAKAEGYENSEVVTATLCWIEVEETGTHINEQIKAKAVLIQSHEGMLLITGAIDDVIEIYDITGKLIASAYASSGTTTIETMLKSGDIALVKIKGKTIKVVMR